MSELFQEMCKLIKRINSIAFNAQMQGKVEKFHLGLNQTMSHYVNKYGSDWGEFVNYAPMAHRAIPHSITRYSQFYLLHGRQMRLPMEDDLVAARFSSKGPKDDSNTIQDHIDTLADRLEEAYRVTRENNKMGSERQKEQYDKGTKLIIFQPGDVVYLRKMIRRKVLRRLSDLYYLVRVARNKEVVVNVNKMKRCHQKTPSLPSIPTGIPTAESERDGGQERTDEEGMTSPIPYNNFENSDSSVPIPPVEINDEREDQTQDPTWEPRVRQETRITDDRRESGTRYWLRHRQEDTQAVPDDVASEAVEEQTDNEATGIESLTSQKVEVGQEQKRDEGNTSSPQYNFRPLPGRKLNNF
jgi:hypothetical protein